MEEYKEYRREEKALEGLALQSEIGREERNKKKTREGNEHKGFYCDLIKFEFQQFFSVTHHFNFKPQAKDNFKQMLRERININSDTKFYKISFQLMNDFRWRAVEERDRETIFQDYLDDLFEEERAEKREKR